MIIVLNDLSGDKLAAIELEDAPGATVADLLEAARGAMLPRGRKFSLLLGDVTLHYCTAFGDDAPLSDLGISDGMTITFVEGRLHDVVTCGDITAKIWDSRTGECKLTLSGDSDGCPYCFAVGMADLSMVLTVSYNHTAELWDIATGEVQQTFFGHSNHINTAVFSANGSSVLTGSDDATAQVWDIATGECVLTLRHYSEVRSAVFSTDESVILTSSRDTTAKIWDRYTGTCKLTLWGHSNALSNAVFSADNFLVLTSSWDTTAKIWDRYSGQCILTLSGYCNELSNAMFSADDSLVLTTGHDAAIIWDRATGECTLTLLFGNRYPNESFRNMFGNVSLLKSAAFSPDDSSVLACCWHEVSIWDSTTGECKLMITECDIKKCFISAMYSPDGVFIVTASKDHTAKIWDSLSGELLQTLSGHIDVVRFANFF